MTTKSCLLAAALALAAPGCGPVEVSGGAYVSTPQLASLGPDLYVVADGAYPVFYVDNLYWLYYDGFWYQSSYWDRGWVVAVTVPIVIGGIVGPERYAHFHGGPYLPPPHWPRDHRIPYTPAPRTVDHRRPAPRPPGHR